MLRTLAFCGITTLLVASTSAQQFTVNAAALPAQNVWSNGVEFTDVEKDGDLDVVVANGSTYGAGGQQPQHLFLNNGAGIFSAAHAQLNVVNFNAQMVIAEDFDKDGDEDLLYAPAGAFPATTQVPRMLMNNGAGVFADESATRLPVVTMSGWSVCAGDVDNDLDLDVVFIDGALTFSGQPSQARLFLNNGSGFFTNATATNFPVDIYNAQDVTLFDYDGDFDVDTAISGFGGGSRLYLNDGSGVFTMDNALNIVGTANTYEIDWGDLDADGDLDGMVQSITGMSEGWARNNGAGVAATNTTFPTPNGNDDNELAGVDYDNDGDLDVFVASLQSGVSGQEKLYRNDGGVFVNNNGAIQAGGDSTLDFAFGDLNGDGKYDMYTAQGESGNFTDKVYVNSGPADTIRPAFLKKETPAALGATNTIFRVNVQDAIQDDGKARNYRVTYTWATSGAAPSQGSGVAFHQGGGTWRATVPTPAGTIGACVQWTARDERNNFAVTAAKVGTVSSFADLGLGVPGASGTPLLGGAGTVVGGSTLTFGMSGFAAGAPGALVVGSGYAGLPLCSGALVPTMPFAPPYPFVTDGAGNASKSIVWPAGLFACTSVYLQAGVLDAAACPGFSLSNGLRVTQP